MLLTQFHRRNEYCRRVRSQLTLAAASSVNIQMLVWAGVKDASAAVKAPKDARNQNQIPTIGNITLPGRVT